ncbi:MAG: hypothetical protein VKJ64_12775 [Leptolyngbyaceae bacterium]|nr:hypothetical protein [Leptolyngbyaceae bacterium]
MNQFTEHRQQIHQLVDRLPTETLAEALTLLEGLSRRAEQMGQEMELLGIIHRCLPLSQQQRWQELRQKLEAETLTEREHQEFLTYSDLLESWNAERVGAIAQLAMLRQVEFDALYQELTSQGLGV